MADKHHVRWRAEWPEQSERPFEVGMNEEVDCLQELLLQAITAVRLLMDAGFGEWVDIDVRESVGQFIATGEIPNWWPETYTGPQKIRLRRRLSTRHRFRWRVETHVAERMIHIIGERQHLARETLSPQFDALASASRSLAQIFHDPQVRVQLMRLWDLCELVKAILSRDLASFDSIGIVETKGLLSSDVALAPRIREFLCATSG
jgi:hypothetical protein